MRLSVFPTTVYSVQRRESVIVERRAVDERGHHLGLVRLNRPESMNALDSTLVPELFAAVESLIADPDVRAIAIVGTGRAFCAGGDLKAYELALSKPEVLSEYRRSVRALFALLRACEKPCLALVNGLAVAGGLELAISCDIVYAAASARLADGHQRHGIVGGGGVLARLASLIGTSRARELIFTARFIDAHEAYAWGLVTKVVEDELLVEEAEQFARTVAAHSPRALAHVKRLLEQIANDGLGVHEAALIEGQAVADQLASRDAREGLRAFVEKRTPDFDSL